MKGLHKSKRVSWASDVNLCQVKLFLSDDCPSQAGLDSQEHLQAKASWLPHSTGTGSDDILPPGFEGAHPENQLQTKVSQIPVVKWRFPPMFVLNSTWRVVAGEESKEVEIQSQREMRVLEAIYPRPSSIPPNPSVSADAEESHGDGQTPSIPITPIEDEDLAAETSFGEVAQLNTPMSSQLLDQPFGISPSIEQPGVTPAAEPDVLAAASAAFTVIMNGNEQGNPIDRDLLIKILSNPKMIEKLVTEHGTAANLQNQPISRPAPVTLSDPSPAHINTMQTSHLSTTALSNGPLHLVPPPFVSVSPQPSQPSTGAPPPKDINYYKSLIQQHGGDRQETLPQYVNRYGHLSMSNQEMESANNQKSRDSKPKIMKPCIYFNSSRGCRHGANCVYQHEPSFQPRGGTVPEAQGAKRMKMDGDISS